MIDERYVKETRGRWTLYLRREKADALLSAGFEDPEAVVGNVQSDLEPSGRAAVALIPFENGYVAVRKYLHGGLFRFLTGGTFLSRKRPLGELEAVETARDRGVSVPEPFGAAVRRKGPVFCAYLFSRFIDNACDLAEYLSSAGPKPGERRAAVAAAGRQVRILHDAGIMHGDLHLRNILVRAAEEPDVFIIDFDKSCVKEKLSIAERERNLMRLGRSIDKLPDPARVSNTEMARFMSAYLAPGGVDVDLKLFAKRLAAHRARHLRTRKLPGQKEKFS